MKRMATDPKIDTYQRSVLEFKSSTFTVPVLVLAENDLNAIEAQLTIKIQQAPEFFKNSPLIIDLNKISTKNLEIDLAGVFEIARTVDLQPIGIRGGNETTNQQAQKLNIALLAEERKQAANIRKTIIPPVETISQEGVDQKQDLRQKQQSATRNTEIISHPVRSGQRVYTAGDLVILAAVSAGAEIMAEGNIHIYGVLRGRALAGVQGDENCRIFCSNLQAELISIAGNYQVSDNINDRDRGKPVQIQLDKQKLIVNAL
jgi:septum site-determining protein MinC